MAKGKRGGCYEACVEACCSQNPKLGFRQILDSVKICHEGNTRCEGLDSVVTFGFGSFCELSYSPILANVAAF